MVGNLDALEMEGSTTNISAAAYDAAYVEQDGETGRRQSTCRCLSTDPPDTLGSLGRCSVHELGENETAPAMGEECSHPADCWRVDINAVCSPAFTCICKPATLYNKRWLAGVG